MKILVTLLILLFPISVSAYENEISLLDSNGEAVVYIDVDDELAIYTWGGHANAYLDGSVNDLLRGNTIDVYGWNGKHLGWYFDGVIMNHAGDASCSIREVHPNPKPETFKSVQYVQYVKYVQYIGPVQPFFSGRFGGIDCLALINSGSVN